jgi:hypothetical protein
MTKVTFAVTIVSAPSELGKAESLAQKLNQAGLTTRLSSSQPSRGAGEIALIVLLAIPFRSFLEALGASLGDSAGTAVKNLIERAVSTSDQNEHYKCIIVRDSQRGIDFEFTDDLPLEAYDKLGELGPGRSGTLRYERSHGEWIYVQQIKPDR